MLEVEVVLKNIEGSRLADRVGQETEVTFNANAALVEAERNPGSVTLRFTIDLETNPEVAKISVSGTAVLKGEDQEINQVLTVKDEQSAPPVFMKIYQKVYAITYLLCGSLKIPYPSPGLLKMVHVASSKEMSRSVGKESGSANLSV